MAMAPLNVYREVSLLGQFRNAETGVTFEYSLAPNKPFGDEYCCAVWLAGGHFRYAKVLRTVAYVVVDENANGTPAVERWEIRSHKEYPA